MADYDVTFIERDDTEARFLVRGVTPAFANGIRRAMIADVPTFSIDTVRFIENSSVMFDEQLALRLGLIPLTTPLGGEFDEDDTVTLALDVEGPETAYSGDLVSSDDMVQPAEEDVPIIDLKDGQRLELEADAVLGYGQDHAKHQGGVAVGYRHLQRVEVVGDRDEFRDDEPEIVRGVIETEGGELVPTEEFDNDLTERYPDSEVEVHDVENAFVFDVETDGSFDVDTLVQAGIDSIRGRAEELKEAVQL
ncbi:DNA-directed RNA polymerase subunit D [Halapricum hydrolyticum]|uniref:DNA-directed RNA polymerase subunit Rpo3 n=1 Tax=Halapricum hydrolyticum TaxID=2979991 RepID=A0AAE3IDJ8_9EURY|nr:DNA-directed RNA polymerase subunit D [Halapricum hydrolyticum]MCU4718299.1 DNA-directed RNA polymerase subunit D [Halapricum hydrolyticum]MCU4727253.1 DNA-directed RNA polymerase subunit D [Halapricum hydrolyticum]